MAKTKFNARKIVVIMANKGLIIGQLAELSGVSRVTLSRFINGTNNVRPATIGKIAKALNVSVEELIETAATVNQENGNV